MSPFNSKVSSFLLITATLIKCISSIKDLVKLNQSDKQANVSKFELGNNTTITFPADGDMFNNFAFVQSVNIKHDFKIGFFTQDMGLSEKSFLSVMRRCPQLLQQSLDLEISPFVFYLCSSLRVEPSAIGKIVLAFPRVLSRSVRCNTPSVLEYLRIECGVPQEHLHKIIGGRPQLLALSVDHNLRLKVGL